MILKARMCLRCLDPEYIYKGRTGGPHKDCPIKHDKVSQYSCRNSNCSKHLWISTDHVSEPENNKALLKFRDQLQKKGKRF